MFKLYILQFDYITRLHSQHGPFCMDAASARRSFKEDLHVNEERFRRRGSKVYPGNKAAGPVLLLTASGWFGFPETKQEVFALPVRTCVMRPGAP